MTAISVRPRRAAGRAAVAALVAVLVSVVAVPGAEAQIRRSPWATINVCDPPTARGQVGVRAAVPNRSDAAQWIRIRIQFFDRARRAWRVVRTGGDTGFRRLSSGGARFFGGTTFTITPPAAGRSISLRGLVDMQWRRGPRVLSSAQVTTHRGHADAGDPLLQASAPTCVIRR